MGTYCQLIRALDMDQRADEAHKFWEKKIGIDLHSVPWQLCRQMIAIYYRNNMLENLVKVCFAMHQVICFSERSISVSALAKPIVACFAWFRVSVLLL